MNLESLQFLADIERKNKNKGIDPVAHESICASLRNSIRFLEIGILELLDEIKDEKNKKDIVLKVRKNLKTKYNIDRVHSKNFLRNLQNENEDKVEAIKYLLNAT